MIILVNTIRALYRKLKIEQYELHSSNTGGGIYTPEE
jgi:hypothetical protein